VNADGGLHVRELEVVANVRIDVLVVVSAGELAELPLEALAAGVVFAGSAPQSRPQSRKDSMSLVSAGLLVMTAPPRPGDVVAG